MDQPFQNGDVVQLRHPDEGTLVGRSVEHGAGQKVPLPQGTPGEVLGTDPSTGLVNVLCMGKFFEQFGAMEPFGATVWSWPSDLIPRPDLRKPGPNVVRTRPDVPQTRTQY